MKKLFLASFAAVSLDLIAGLLPKPASKLTAAFIPTAADPYENRGFAYVDREKLVSMGFKVIDVDLKESRGEKLAKILAKVDLILVAGGNTFYLLDQVKKSGFDSLVKKLVKKGVIYVGSSAGSILCCPTIEGAQHFDTPAAAPNLTNYTGLNLFDKVLIPHAQKEKYAEKIQQTKEEVQKQGFEVITLTDNQAVILSDDEVKVVEIPP